ncbi:hypothetical protein PRIPAC_90430, partial [Pristionchus pacificus]|uniref:SERPIN domain-containing protein n=1 Tax=Pristionchus pacificus TaxID=54126 RepID=A0A2A6CWN1_PRIPA
KAPSHTTTEFALDLLRAASGPAANFVLSPFSLGSSLAMLHDGARGATQKELTTLLGKTLSPGEVSMIYSTLETSHAIMNSSVQIRSANKMFIDKVSSGALKI